MSETCVLEHPHSGPCHDRRPRPVERPCPRCDGCGQIADSDDGEPWTAWTSLPVQSALAVVMGMVKPIPCPECDGAGVVSR
jgi:RecJ-like exonuclease